ncbi:amidohydrolase family protein [Azospirillum rugosum]|uniref:5-methylthioadenosine/S-adenosylhomocysteine deaminase n=1 Tax=Azospirillum rugosum TaxID=416170 RepID=A0ABS4SVI2_9PROT|nr:amidohydrolase family protein [Azospirillum rugosum]MBP2296574.1 5-methylthioadenosine/S-adenosylhomocysteine deaminase [Azospirillum rugosum]MDQ0530026.1 5-methylthioadenosine/S-adenosylhomocysteine deaminase [Azospirillum rugosum]
MSADITAGPLDLLLTGATVLTGETTGTIVEDAAIGIRDGRIVHLAPASKPFPSAKVTRALPGRLVTPGFINAHLHAVLVMVRGVAADLGFAPSYTPGIPKGTDATPEEARALARLGAVEALLSGSTLVCDHFVHADATLDAIAELGLRVHAGWRVHDVDFARVANGEWSFDAAIGDDLLRRTLDLHDRWHGANGGRIQVQMAAHAPDTCSPAFLRTIAGEAAARNMRVNTHLAQSRVEVERVKASTGLSPAELLDEVGLLNDRLLATHCLYVSDTDIARLAASGAHAVHVPKCNAASGRLAPTPALKAAGVNLALCTDTQHGDMVEAMRWALATARIQQGGVTADWQPADVFRMATLGGAKAVGMADDIGTLAVGKKADLVVFDTRRPHLRPLVNPLGTLVHTGQGRDVEMVLVDGETLVEDGRPVRADLDRICIEADQAARALWARARA